MDRGREGEMDRWMDESIEGGWARVMGNRRGIKRFASLFYLQERIDIKSVS